MKSNEYKQGFTDALVYIIDVFDTRKNAMYSRGWFRKKDVTRVVNILYAALRARDKLMEIGPKKMDLIVHKDGTNEFRERTTKPDGSV